MYLRLFAHILVGFLIGALYYDIGNDGAKVLSNLGEIHFLTPLYVPKSLK